MTTKGLSYSAMSISLIFVFFLLFRGATNIVNSFVIPVILYQYYRKFTFKEYLVLVLAVFIFSFLFFFQQIFFVIFYAVMALLLDYLFRNNKSLIYRLIITTIVFLILFIITISLTDIVLGTALRKVLFSVVGGNQIALSFLYLAISLIVSIVLNITVAEVNKRLIVE